MTDAEIGELWAYFYGKHDQESSVVVRLIRKLVEERTQRHFSTVTYSVDCKVLALKDFGIDPEEYK